MGRGSQLGRWGVLVIVGLSACEVLIMISPFAGFFYTSVHFRPLLGFLSMNPLTAWLDGFFLNHAVVTDSWLLESQRTIGLYVFALGLWAFLISAVQVYGNKILGRGVATGLLYRVSRHPQYLSLAIAGWGLITIWPRFLLLGSWVSMLFLYAGLARFEESRMEERFGDAYRRYRDAHGAFLPGSPVRRLFESTCGRLRPRPLGWLTAYVICLALAFTLAGGLRGYTRSHTVTVGRPQARTMIISAWPQPEAWVNRIFDTALADQRVRDRIAAAGEGPLVATILPDRYVMKGMHYVMPPAENGAARQGGAFEVLRRIGREAVMMLVPIEGLFRPEHFMGLDPDTSTGVVEVVISRAEKPYKDTLPFAEILDASVRLIPLVVADLPPAGGEVTAVRSPLPRNRWGSEVVMPLF